MLVYALANFLCYLCPSITENNFAIRGLVVGIATVAIDYSNNNNKTFYVKRIRRRRKIEYLSQQTISSIFVRDNESIYRKIYY